MLPDIVMTKTANPTSIPFQGGQVIYTFVVWNRSAETATLTTLTDNRFGDLDGKGNCDVPVSLAASDGVQGGADTYTCTYLVTFGRQTVAPGGTGFTPHVNVAMAVATDDDTNSDTATDDASVSFTWRGRTPGYWKNHTAEWPKFSVVNTAGVSVQVTPTTKVRSVFAVPATSTYSCIKSTDTLSTALGYKGGSTTCGAAQILLREAASALLNEAMFGDAYPGATSVQSLITQVNTTLATNDRTKILALATYLDYWNNGVR